MYPPRYIKEILIKDEKLLYFRRPHWIIYGPGVIALIFAALFYTYGPTYFILRSRLLGVIRFMTFSVFYVRVWIFLVVDGVCHLSNFGIRRHR